MSFFNSSRFNSIVNTDLTAFILRVFAGFFMFFGHGWSKLMQVLGGNFQFADPLGLGPELSLILTVFGEAICTVLIMVGFYTRFAALVLTINMAVAFLFVHISDPFAKMEMALLYLLCFFVIFLLGPGKYSIDGSSR